MNPSLPVRAHLQQYERFSYVDHTPADARVLDCSFGVSPFGPPPGIESLHLDCSGVAAYPPYPFEELRQNLVDYWAGLADLSIDMLTVSSGSMPVLERLCELLIDPGDNVIGIAPQFPEFIASAERAGATYEPVVSDLRSNIDASVDELCARLQGSFYDIVYIDNPNNPTGRTLGLEVINRVCRVAARAGSAVIVDEAYGDYLDDDASAVLLTPRYENIFVVRSFSKAYALAGARVGYLVASARASSWYGLFDDMLVSTVSVGAALFALRRKGFIQYVRRSTLSAKTELVNMVSRTGFVAYKTDCRTPISLLAHPDPDCDMYHLLLSSGVKTARGFRHLGKKLCENHDPR